MKTKLAIVLPCYNEEEILPFSIEKLSQLFDQLIKKEVISDSSFMLFVNDGSNDNTWNIIKDYNTINKYVYGIKLSHNVGHQKAIMAGMMAARSELSLSKKFLPYLFSAFMLTISRPKDQ